MECLRPRRCGTPWSDNSRESHSAGAVRGDRHCPRRKIGASPFVENLGGVYKARYEPWLIDEHEKREQDFFPVPVMIDRLSADKTSIG